MRVVSEVFSCVGTPTEHLWAQSFEMPHVSGVIEVTSELEARTIGITILSRITSTISKHTGDLDSLKKAIAALLPPEVTSFVVVMVQGTTLHIMLLRAGAVYMRRGKTFALLKKNPGVMSGEIKVEDSVLVLTTTAALHFSKIIADILSPELSPPEVAEALSIEFSELEQKGAGMAGVVIAVQAVLQEQSHLGNSPRIHKRRSLPNLQLGKLFVSLKTRFRERPYLLLAVAFGIFFVISVILGIHRQANDKTYQQMIASYNSANTLFEQGIAMMSVDQLKSRDLFKEAQDTLTAIPKNAIPAGKDARNINALQAKISDNLAIVSKVNKQSLQLFYDADFLQKGRHITHMVVQSGNLFFLDNSTGFLGVVALQNKNADILAGGAALTNATSITASSTNVYALTTDGVRKIAPGQTESKIVIPKDKIQGSPSEVVTFGGNIYLVDPPVGKLWRYVAKDGVYDTAQSYFSEDGPSPDLSKTTNVVIDGSIWFGTTLGKIVRYTQGAEDPILIHGIDPPLGGTLQVAKEETGEVIYILDAEHKRVVFVNATGGYVSQFVWSDDISPTAIAVSQTQKRIYLLASQKIFSLTLQ